MIHHLSGTLVVKTPGYVVLESGGIGYRVDIPLSTYEKLPRAGPTKIFTWLKVSEDALRLYGFATEGERDFFVRLVESVGQLGPSKALTLLSASSVEELSHAIEKGDASFLKRIKGIGEKLANRLIVELKGKLPEELAGKEAVASSTSKDAVAALLALGYARPEAEEAVRRANRELTSDASLEDVVKRSLLHV